MKLWAVVAAAGVGMRFGGAYPKQYLKLSDDNCVLDLALTPLLNLAHLQNLVVCLAKDDQNWTTTKYAHHPKIVITQGGKTRAQSVLNGLHKLSFLGAKNEDWVLVHDAARPNLTEQDLHNLIDEVKDDVCGGILAHPVADSLKQAITDENGITYIQKNIDRTNIWCAFTPQIFSFGILKQALERYPHVADEAEALTLAGYKVRLIMGSKSNFKITHASDLSLFGRQYFKI